MSNALFILCIELAISKVDHKETKFPTDLLQFFIHTSLLQIDKAPGILIDLKDPDCLQAIIHTSEAFTPRPSSRGGHQDDPFAASRPHYVYMLLRLLPLFDPCKDIEEVHGIVGALLGPLEGALCLCHIRSPRTSLSEMSSDSYGEKRELAIDLEDQVICLSTCSESLHILWDGVRKSLIAEEVIYGHSTAEPLSSFICRRLSGKGAPIAGQASENVAEMSDDTRLTSQQTLFRLIAIAQRCLQSSLDIADTAIFVGEIQALKFSVLDLIVRAVRRGAELLSKILDWSRTSNQGRSSKTAVLICLRIAFSVFHGQNHTARFHFNPSIL